MLYFKYKNQVYHHSRENIIVYYVQESSFSLFQEKYYCILSIEIKLIIIRAKFRQYFKCKNQVCHYSRKDMTILSIEIKLIIIRAKF